MNAKHCPRCNTFKPLDAFGIRTVRGRVGRQSYCKDCMVAAHREWRRGEGRDAFYAGLDRSRRRPEIRARMRAGDKVRKAVRAGRLVRGTCEVGVGCVGEIHAHHDDYSQPLNVRWLCRRHHAAADVARRRADMAESTTNHDTNGGSHGL